jgi:hypothetical protein
MTPNKYAFLVFGSLLIAKPMMKRMKLVGNAQTALQKRI